MALPKRCYGILCPVVRALHRTRGIETPLIKESKWYIRQLAEAMKWTLQLSRRGRCAGHAAVTCVCRAGRRVVQRTAGSPNGQKGDCVVSVAAVRLLYV